MNKRVNSIDCRYFWLIADVKNKHVSCTVWHRDPEHKTQPNVCTGNSFNVGVVFSRTPFVVVVFKSAMKLEWKPNHHFANEKFNEPCGKYGKWLAKCANLCVEYHSNCTAYKLWMRVEKRYFQLDVRAIPSFMCFFRVDGKCAVVAACTAISCVFHIKYIFRVNSVGVVRRDVNKTSKLVKSI